VTRDEFDALHAARLGAIDEEAAAYGTQLGFTHPTAHSAAATADPDAVTRADAAMATATGSTSAAMPAATATTTQVDAAAVERMAAPQIDLATASQMRDPQTKDLQAEARQIATPQIGAPQIDWAGMTVAEMKAEMRSRGLGPLTGRKEDLRKRLVEAMAEAAAAPQLGASQIAAPQIAAPQIDLAGMTVEALKVEMRVRGLGPLKGRKAELIRRLEEAMAAEARRQGEEASGGEEGAGGERTGAVMGEESAGAWTPAGQAAGIAAPGIAAPGIAAPGIERAAGRTVAWAGQTAATGQGAAVTGRADAAGAAGGSISAPFPEPLSEPFSHAAPWSPPWTAGAVGSPPSLPLDVPLQGVQLNIGRRDVEIEISSLKLEYSKVTATGWPATDAASLRELAGAPTEDPPRYGSAYEAFGGGEVGREACIAIEALCRMGAIDTMLNNFILPLQVRFCDSNRRERRGGGGMGGVRGHQGPTGAIDAMLNNFLLPLQVR
jgi:hypothetical protein